MVYSFKKVKLNGFLDKVEIKMNKIKSRYVMNRLIGVLILSFSVNGCLGQQEKSAHPFSHGRGSGENITLPDLGNEDQTKPNNQSNQDIYNKIQKYGATNRQQAVIDQVLQKLPIDLLNKYAKTNNSIEFISGNWTKALKKYGVNPEEKFVDYTSNEHNHNNMTVASHSLAYPVIIAGKLKLLVRADNQINYTQNGEERKRLYYAALRGIFNILDFKTDGEFIELFQQTTKAGINRYSGHWGSAKLIGISNIDEDQINLEYKEEARNNLVYLLANYVEAPEVMTALLPKMARYLNQFNEQSFEFNMNELVNPNKYTISGSDVFSLDIGKAQVFLHYNGEIEAGKTVTTYISTDYMLSNPPAHLFPYNPISISDTSSAQTYRQITALKSSNQAIPQIKLYNIILALTTDLFSSLSDSEVILNQSISQVNLLYQGSGDDIGTFFNEAWQMIYTCSMPSSHGLITIENNEIECDSVMPQIAEAIHQLPVDATSQEIMNVVIADLTSHFKDLSSIYFQAISNVLKEYNLEISNLQSIDLHDLAKAVANSQIDEAAKKYILQIINHNINIERTLAQPNLDLATLISFASQERTFARQIYIDLAVSSGFSENNNGLLVKMCHFTQTNRDCTVNLSLNDIGYSIVENHQLMGIFGHQFNIPDFLSGSKYEEVAKLMLNYVDFTIFNISGGKAKLVIQDQNKIAVTKLITIQ